MTSSGVVGSSALALLVVAVVACRAWGADLNLTHYRPVPDCAEPVAVPNGDFAAGVVEWALGEGWKLDPGGGRELGRRIP